MTRLAPVPAALVTLASVVAGLLFAPVFGVWPLVLPLLVPATVSLAIAVAVSRREALVPWRPVLALLGGLLGVVETMLWSTTVAGLPTGSTARALGSGITGSWQLALQSTWPARPDPGLMLFVPLLVLLAGVLGMELLHRWGALPSLAPSFAVLVLSQFYGATTGVAAVLAALAYAAAAGALLVATRPERVSTGRRLSSGLLFATPAVVLAVIGALLGALVLPGDDARYTLRDEQFAPLTASSLTNPLDLLSYRLTHPGVPVFTVDGASAVDRWPVVVLSGFDGVNWTPGSAYRRLGSALAPSPDVTVEVERRTARISGARLDGPWLPSQPSPAAVGGIRPLVEERQGSLLAPDAPRPASYTLSWWEPQVHRDDLVNAAIDRDVAAGTLGGVGQVPDGIAELADRAVPARPTFRTAVALADFLRTEYRLATGQNLPTGHSWAQLREFLLDSKRGTSEQFAAAYVALARMKGIPARLVVGFRTPADRDGGRYTVRNGDALAWPEVAVEGVGWVPLDPSGSAGAAGGVPARGLAAATEEVRRSLPDRDELRDAPVAPEPTPPGSDSGDGWPVPWWVLLAVPAAAVLAWLTGVPLAKALRARGRRRRPGAATVIGAWEEARDALRAHGVPVSPGMTVRDLTTVAVAAQPLGDEATHGLRSLGAAVDVALWSGTEPGPESGTQAWAAVRAVRKGLARRGLRARIRAAVNPAPLRPPR
ncbi:transglutaminaseTgpA domain-containing protein [Prauserella muralis]|uniref:transglutaminase family protein n=1 Tax=Prauserella muralis TaxID=588067 RepID=UPI000DD3E0D3|nr:transglutaminase domain-containing protein [Prauserella muralis]TWE28579.1 transglutaminase superfamily protein [Prauserella muralis]